MKRILQLQCKEVRYSSEGHRLAVFTAGALEGALYKPGALLELNDQATLDNNEFVPGQTYTVEIDLPQPTPIPSPIPAPPGEDYRQVMRFDTVGAYHEYYGGKPVYTDPAIGRFIWNDGPPRRKNPLTDAAGITKVYVNPNTGEILDPQP